VCDHGSAQQYASEIVEESLQ